MDRDKIAALVPLVRDTEERISHMLGGPAAHAT